MTLYNPAALAGLAWDLGGGWGFSDIVGGYAPADNELRLLGSDIWVFDERAALSYAGNKWNLTANVIYGLTGKDLQTGRRLLPDYLSVDLTAVKTLGNWEAGAVAFYSTDLESIAYGPAQCGAPSNTRITPKCEQAQFAAGGLIGYEFSGITTQLWATTDVWTQNYLNGDGSRSYEKRVWARVIIPLWTAKEVTPFAVPQALVRLASPLAPSRER
ncbi:MAG: transporter [Rhodomicrobium sp.]